MEGGYSDIASGDRFEVGRMRRRLDRRAEREPVIVVAARIGVADDPKPPVLAPALAGDADALDRVGRQRWDIDVYQRSRGKLRLDQRAQHAFSPGGGTGEGHGIPPASSCGRTS